MKPILSGTFTSITPHGALVYAYRECTITYTRYSIAGVYVIVIQDYNFDQRVLAGVRAGTQSERISLGMTRSSSAAITSSAMRQSDYIEADNENYGTLFGDKVFLVKKKGRRKRPLFNYMCHPASGGAPYIMYSQDFYSAFPFQHNIAYAWGTDGHKYELGAGGRMRMVENVKTINNIITETINDYLRKNLLLAS